MQIAGLHLQNCSRSRAKEEKKKERKKGWPDSCLTNSLGDSFVHLPLPLPPTATALYCRQSTAEAVRWPRPDFWIICLLSSIHQPSTFISKFLNTNSPAKVHHRQPYLSSSASFYIPPSLYRHRHDTPLRNRCSSFLLFFFSSPTTVDKPATDRRLSLILPIPSLRLSALSLSPNSRRRSLLLELARSDDSPPFLPAGSWRWSFSPPAIASASRSTNSGIMTGLIGERGFAPARFST